MVGLQSQGRGDFVTGDNDFLSGTGSAEGAVDDGPLWRMGSLDLPREPWPPAPPRIAQRPSMVHYERALRHFTAHPDRTGALSHLRELAIRGVRAGTLTPRELLFEVRPAAVAVSVLTERPVASTGAVLAKAIRAAADGRPSRWADLTDQVGSWTGSLASLLNGRDDTEIGGYLSVPPSHPRVWTGHRWRPANIMLALATPLGAQRFFTEATGQTAVRRDGAAQEMARFMPLTRALVDHTMGPRGTGRGRVNLAGNAFTPDTVLAELLSHAGQPAVATAVREHDFACGTVRQQAFLAVRDRPDAIRKSLEVLLKDGQQQFLDLLDAVPDDDPVWIHTLIRHAENDLRPDTRRVAYERLAAVSEPEVVWTMELARVGSLDALPSEVRASMSEGSAAPLTAAVREQPFWDSNSEINAVAAEMRREEVLDRPLPWLDG
jgi:hypothetical protein